MICLQKSIEYKYGETILVKPIFDVHYGAPGCDVRHFKKFLADDPDAWLIGGGDLLNSIVTSDLKRYRKSEDGTVGDDIIDQQVNGMVDMLKPYKERIIGLGTGNHEDTITRKYGTNPTKRMCRELGVPFLGYSFGIELKLRETDGRGRTVKIRGHHGWGGGSRTEGGSLTKYSKEAANWEADIFLYGHDHKKQSVNIERTGFTAGALIAMPKLVVLCGTYLKTFSSDENPTYSERAGYSPTPIGGLTIEIKPNNRWVDYWVNN